MSSGYRDVVTRLVCTLAALLVAAPAASALPRGWPDRFELGLSSQPGDATALRAKAPLGFRYQYLAGGVNTGSGWSTWNENGTFVSRYVDESRGARMIPVLTYYMMLQSRPAAGSSELERDLSNLRNADTMRAYWRDLRLALRRARGRRLVVLHVEPDLWGYMQQAARRNRAASVPAAVASSGDRALRGLPDNAAGFARAIVRLRNRLAPNVALAWHLSVWGTKEDPTYSNPSRARIAQLARISARFYRSLGARFDVVFNDVEDRDAGYNRVVNGDGGASRWDAGDFHRHAAYIRGFTRRVRRKVVVWQIPLGNSTLPDTWGRYKDDRVEWWLGESSRAHLREARRAGIVALLFGGGADGTTTAETDGGLFYRLAKRYYEAPQELR
jgi:hypothetical protein